MKVELLTRVQEMFASLSSKQKQVAAYVLENAYAVSTMTMRELATECNVAEPTVVRFINTLGYDSFLAFRVDIAREINLQAVSDLGDGYTEIRKEDSTAVLMHKATEAISHCLRKTESALDTNRIDLVAELMQQAGRIVFYGAGNSCAIAMDASYRLYRIGVDSFCSENLHIVLTSISRLTKQDIVVLISHSGESMDMLECAKAAVERGVKVIGITGNMDSPLAQIADYVLFTHAQDSVVYSDAMVSRIAQMMILDVLYMKIRLAQGENAKEKVRDARNTILNLKKNS